MPNWYFKIACHDGPFKVPNWHLERGNQFDPPRVLVFVGPSKNHADLIRILRGKRVILDRDLARLYGVEVKALNRAVRRNLERFPEDFMLRLSSKETQILRCQIGTLGWGTYSKYSAMAFTEQGVAMLSSVLRSPRAVAVNIAIMRAFVRLREAVQAHGELGRRLAEVERTLTEHGAALGEHAQLIQEGLDAIARLMQEPEGPRKRIGFEGK